MDDDMMMREEEGAFHVNEGMTQAVVGWAIPMVARALDPWPHRRLGPGVSPIGFRHGESPLTPMSILALFLGYFIFSVRPTAEPQGRREGHAPTPSLQSTPIIEELPATRCGIDRAAKETEIA
jgi:hypothetical protein